MPLETQITVSCAGGADAILIVVSKRRMDDARVCIVSRTGALTVGTLVSHADHATVDVQAIDTEQAENEKCELLLAWLSLLGREPQGRN